MKLLYAHAHRWVAYPAYGIYAACQLSLVARNSNAYSVTFTYLNPIFFRSLQSAVV